MIPSTLPAPAPDAAGAPGPRAEHETGPGFERALDRAARATDPSTPADRPAEPGEGVGRPPLDEVDGDAGGEASDLAPQAPGADGRAQALAAMPLAVPARPVVAGTAHDARPAPEAAEEARPGPTVLAVDVPAPDAVEAPAVQPEVEAEVAATADEVPAEPVAIECEGDADAADRGTASDPGTSGLDEVGDAGAPAPEEVRNAGASSSAPAGDEPPSRPGRADDASTPRRAAVVEVAPPVREPGPLPVTAAPDVTAPLDVTTAGVAPTAAPTASAPTAPAPPAPAAPPVAQQLVAHVTPLAAGPDGTHELTIELRPVELGAVRLDVTLEDGVLSVRVHAEDPASRRLLAQSLGDLRHALVEAGISAGSLDVGDPRGGGATGDREAPGDRSSPSPRAGDHPTPDTRAAARRSLPSRTAVDVLL